MNENKFRIEITTVIIMIHTSFLVVINMIDLPLYRYFLLNVILTLKFVLGNCGLFACFFKKIIKIEGVIILNFEDLECRVRKKKACSDTHLSLSYQMRLVLWGFKNIDFGLIINTPIYPLD
jgi:hypothetical protein